ncbi:TRAP transporter small permease [Oceanobacillus timonensis]|uniref:TRAP transporter small permease n=1 Tax=Oceanobacillus timonensis TaxID=1926285 RepID=UPI0015C463E8|nr:TRAP transporter small permease [Oceanobacillus timonensis]
MKKKISWLYYHAEEIISGFLLASLIIILFVQVIGRYLFNTSFAATVELIQFAFLGLIYITASLGAKKGVHIRVTAHLKLLPEKIRNILAMVTDLIWISFNIFVVYQGLIMFNQMTSNSLYSPVMGWDMKYIFLIIPIGFLLQTIRIVESWMYTIRNKEVDSNAS